MLLFGVAMLTGQGANAESFGQNQMMPAYGLFPADRFVIINGRCTDCDALPQALWYFRSETIAVPKKAELVAGFARSLSVYEDIAAWATTTPVGSVAAYPPLVWLGSPDFVRDAQISADGRGIQTASGEHALTLVAKLPLNGSYFDSSSVAYFHGQPLKIRGNQQGAFFVARTFWPQSFCLPQTPASVSLPADPAAVREWIRRQPKGGAQSPFSVEWVWRRPKSSSPHTGQPIVGLMLNGAQGDDDEAHGGHFALMTGRVGVQGAMDEWLVNNFYTLDSESEKGIIAAPVPLDNYLGDLNSGQAWYRPSYMLVATLRDERTAVHLQSALNRVYNQFYRHQFAYQHARANCAGISVMTSRTLGWQVPVRGPESWLKAVIGLPLVAIKDKSLHKGKGTFDYLTEDQTKLYPAAAFEEMAADLLKLASGQTGRSLSEFERLLADDVEEILLVRVPQLPSSRAWGDFPIENSVEYTARVPKNPAEQKIIPVPPRPFPDELRDPQTPAEPPLRSDFAAAAWGLAFLALILFILRRLLA
ncbi:MAG TPA: hypothetical protein VLA64_00750 [Azonexus sp.]|nr:hypothetical protein [Azonexus sp.]